MEQQDVERVITYGAVGFARTDPGGGFYVRFDVFRPSELEIGLDVTFNPEFVTIEDASTDVLVEWGPRTHIEKWVQDLAANS